MEITLGDIVFGCGSTGGGGGSVSSSHPLPNGIKFVGSTWETFDCGKYDWSQIYDASEMFSRCANLKRIDNFPKNEINGCVYMFNGCSALESIPNGINLKPYYTIENMFTSCTSLTEIPYFDTSKVYSFKYAWYNCKALTEFPQIDTSKCIDFSSAWSACSGLTTFPLLNTSNGTDFSYAWNECSSLTEFPQLDLSNGRSFEWAWRNCSSLTTFPMLDLHNGTNFSSAWAECPSLIEFPAMDLHNGTNFTRAWDNCYALTTIGKLDLSAGTNFYSAWGVCRALTTLGGFGAIKESIELSFSPLTVESIMNVITQAADLNSLGITGKTMTLGSTNLAKLSDEQKAVATSKGWTLA